MRERIAWMIAGAACSVAVCVVMGADWGADKENIFAKTVFASEFFVVSKDGDIVARLGPVEEDYDVALSMYYNGEKREVRANIAASKGGGSLILCDDKGEKVVQFRGAPLGGIGVVGPHEQEDSRIMFVGSPGKAYIKVAEERIEAK